MVSITGRPVERVPVLDLDQHTNMAIYAADGARSRHGKRTGRQGGDR